MKSKILLFVMVAVLSARSETVIQDTPETREWEKLGWTKVKIFRPLSSQDFKELNEDFNFYPENDQQQYTHEIPLTMVRFRIEDSYRGEIWSHDQVLDSLANLTRFYSQCGVRVASSATLVQGIVPVRSWTSLRNTDGDTRSQILDRTPNGIALPVTYFFGRPLDERNQPYAGGIGVERHAIAWATKEEHKTKEGHPMAAAFMSTQAYESGNATAIFAHELAHILFHPGHVEDQNNFMYSGPRANAEITRAQCEQLKNSSYVRKIGSFQLPALKGFSQKGR